MMISQHIPVMMKEAIEALNIRDNLDYIDATFGGGGYSKEILKKADCNLLSIDKDPIVKNYAKKLKIRYKKRFRLVFSIRFFKFCSVNWWYTSSNIFITIKIR